MDRRLKRKKLSDQTENENDNLPGHVAESCDGDRRLSQSLTPPEVITIDLSARENSKEPANNSSSQQELPSTGTWPIVFSPNGNKPACVNEDDIPKLNKGKWLNGNLIQFYLRWLQDCLTTDNPELANHIFFYDTFFYEKLANSESERGINYDAVKSCTAKMDLISYKYIIVPIHEHSNHWYVAIICNPSSLLNLKPTIIEDSQTCSTKDAIPVCDEYYITETRIITLDSLSGVHPQACAHLTDYLLAEIQSKHSHEIHPLGSLGVAATNIPQQDNTDDCGPFLLIYIQQFLENPDEFIPGVLKKFIFNIQWPNPSYMRNNLRDILKKLAPAGKRKRAPASNSWKRGKTQTRSSYRYPDLRPESWDRKYKPS